MTMLALTYGDDRPQITPEGPARCEDDMEDIEEPAEPTPPPPPPPSPPPPRYRRTEPGSAGESDGHSSSTSNDAGNGGAEASARDGPALEAAKAFGMGLGAIVATPFAVAGVGVLAAGAAVWGAAKVLQGVGGLLAAGPEAAARAAAGGRRADGRADGRAGEAPKERQKKDKKGSRESKDKK